MKRLIKVFGTLTIIALILITWFVTTMNETGLYEMLDKSHNSPMMVKAIESIGGPNYDELSWYWAKSVFAMPDDYKDIESIRDNAYAEYIRLSNISVEDDISLLREEVVLELMLISIREKTLTTKGWVVNKYVNPEKGITYLNRLVKINDEWSVLSDRFYTPERLSAWGNFRLKTKKQRLKVGISEEEHYCGDTKTYPEQKGFEWIGGECQLNIKVIK
jgi:hypothetical protein